MKWCISVLFLIVASGVSNAQTAQCPPDTVCLTPTEMQFYLSRDDAAKAFEKEVKALKLAIDGDPSAADEALKLGWRGRFHKLEVDFSRVAGEYSGFKQGRVAVDTAFQTAVANTKKKCLPLSICF